MEFSPIEKIAESIEAWGDGWRFMWNPDDHGRRARITREQSAEVRVEMEIHHQPSEGYFLFACAAVFSDRHGWTNVSISLRNPVNRKAIDYINAELDKLERVS